MADDQHRVRSLRSLAADEDGVNPQPPLVFVVDNEQTTCEALARLIVEAGLRVRTFRSATELFLHDKFDEADCLVLDVHLPDMNGLVVQNALARVGITIPIVFIAGHGDVRTSVRAMKGGAIEFLMKPFDSHDLLSAVRRGVERRRANRRRDNDRLDVRRRYASLTQRERDVFALVVRGFLNKQIADELGIAEATVKIHRAHVMQKMAATSVADLVRKAHMVPDGSGEGA